MALRNGTRLGPYEVVSWLGSGGMGEVYRARDARLGRDVAVKVLSASFSSDADRLKRFEQEARAAGILNHPNITVLHDIGSHDGAPYVVSELLEGETLRSRLATGGAFPAKIAIDYAIQIAHGLAAAHEKGIVHRDLKPENLFLTKDGRVKILDFGLAKLTHPENKGTPLTELPTATVGTEAGVVMGTLGYMSPEQVRGQPVDPRSDIFAFGAVLYEMLTGKRAFSGASPADVMSAILTADLADLTTEVCSASPALDRIVRHCLEKNPEERFQSARDLAFDLESLSTASKVPSEIAASRAWSTKARLTAGSLAVLLTLIVLAAGIFVGRQWGNTSPPAYQQVTHKHGSIASARFAPDGQTILYSAAWAGDPLQGFLKRPETPDAVLLGPANALLLSVSPSGEIAFELNVKPSAHRLGLFRGTLARAPLAGGSPRELLEGVQQADWTPDGASFALVRESEKVSRLECPPGNVLYETRAHLSYPRVSRKGDTIAFFDHPLVANDMGSVAVVSLSGKKRVLTSTLERLQGLAWAPSGDEIWFSAQDGLVQGIYAVTLSGKQRLIARAPGTLRLHDAFRDGRALVSRDSVEVSTFALAPGESHERDLTWLDWSAPTFLSPDGKTVLFLENWAPMGRNYSACLRRTDGSPVVRLGDGVPMALSPDGKWVLARLPAEKNSYVLLPTGAGEPRRIAFDGLDEYRRAAAFMPDGREIIFLGRQAQEAVRFYRGLVGGGKARPVTPPAGGRRFTLSRDGRRLAAYSEGVPAIFSLDAGPNAPPRPIPGATSADVPIEWSEDGRWLYLSQDAKPAMKIFRVEVETGRRTIWNEIAPKGPSGARVTDVFLTPDGKSYAYEAARELSQLYVVEGLK